MTRLLQALHKWLWCSWAHYPYRCSMSIRKAIALEQGCPIPPNAWHCTRCHPCAEGLKELK